MRRSSISWRKEDLGYLCSVDFLVLLYIPTHGIWFFGSSSVSPPALIFDRYHLRTVSTVFLVTAVAACCLLHAAVYSSALRRAVVAHDTLPYTNMRSDEEGKSNLSRIPPALSYIDVLRSALLSYILRCPITHEFRGLSSLLAASKIRPSAAWTRDGE